MKTVCLFALFAGCTAALATPGVLVCHFDTPEMSAAINDFGALGPQVAGFRHLLEPGCPADPAPGVLEAGITDPSGSFTLPIAGDTSLRQGTLELWSKTDWDFGDRSLHVFATIPLLGGYWNSISIGYHGLIGPETEVFESNIMDGVDHPLVVNAGPEGLFWRRGEWHHVALCWTEHSQRLFGDGKLLAATAYSEPLFITAPVGKLHVGCPSTAFGGPLQGLVDELRLCTVPLYAGMDAFPLPDRRLPDGLPPGVSLGAEGAEASADSTAPDVVLQGDVASLHNGVYGDETRIGVSPDTGDATITLAETTRVSGLVWSRDGRPFAGPEGQGWALADSLPRDFVVETSLDGESWTQVAQRERFKIDPAALANMIAARFTVAFEPALARHVRLRITGGTTASLGQWPLLDEVQVLQEDGSQAPIAQVTTERTRFRRSFTASNAIDGRLGEESCWKSANPGRGQLLISFPAVRTVHGLEWSRSREGLASDGTPAEVVVEVSQNGTEWDEAARKRDITEARPCAVRFAPRQARYVRLTILRTTDDRPPALDEVRLAAGGGIP